MATKTPNNDDGGALLKVLSAHFHALVSARSDEIVLRQYAALLRFLRSRKPDFLQDTSPRMRRPDSTGPLPTLSDEELQRASLDEIEKIVSDETRARKDLEYVAIHRFGVPRGSMRSFSNRQMLIDKLRTLISNERAHETIGLVARERASLSSRS